MTSRIMVRPATGSPLIEITPFTSGHKNTSYFLPNPNIPALASLLKRNRPTTDNIRKRPTDVIATPGWVGSGKKAVREVSLKGAGGRWGAAGNIILFPKYHFRPAPIIALPVPRVNAPGHKSFPVCHGRV